MKIPDTIKEISRNLRSNSTVTEKILWEKLRNRKLLGHKFLRQYPVFVFTEDSGLNRFVIPDFICKEYKIIIEVDGGIHQIENVYELDKIKEDLLVKQGFQVLRFTNEQVHNNIDWVLSRVAASFS